MMQSTRTTKGAGQRETGQSSRLTQNRSNQPNGRPGGSAPQGTPPTRRSVLTEHRDALERLAQALLQEEVLEREQVLAIVNGAQKTQAGASGEKASQSPPVPSS